MLTLHRGHVGNCAKLTRCDFVFDDGKLAKGMALVGQCKDLVIRLVSLEQGVGFCDAGDHRLFAEDVLASIHRRIHLIEVLGMRMPEQGVAIKRQIGLVPEDTLLFDHLTAQEYMEFTGRIYGLPAAMTRERMRELLALFEMDGQGRKLIGEYSKGMRKRVAMAAALLHRPQLFLMDEPFEGVDAVGARLMKDILLDLVGKGATIFLTSHVLEVVERLCDRVAIMSHGRLVVDDTMANLRGGTESLEEIFVRVVGGARSTENLEWL